MPQKLEAQIAIARVMELQHHMNHEQQNANRQVAVGRLLSLARTLREYPPETLSTYMKNYYLNSVLFIADEFLEGR